MNHAIRFLLSVCVAVFQGHYLVSAYPDGAPEESCENMLPEHHINRTDPSSPLIEPQSGQPFYSLIVDKTKFMPGDEVQVTLRANKLYFEGFLIQVRDVQTSGGVVKKYGTFISVSNGTKPLCNNQSLTHTHHEHFTSLTMNWTAPNETIKNVRFTAAVVKGYKTYFMNVHSEVLNFASSMSPSLALTLFMFCFMLYGYSF